MAQIVKSIKSNRPIRQPKTGLEELPEVSQSERQPKSLVANKWENRRQCAGIAQMGVDPHSKPKTIEDGRKIK